MDKIAITLAFQHSNEKKSLFSKSGWQVSSNACGEEADSQLLAQENAEGSCCQNQ
jgi:hypothetical protein